ncbi:hypothetical protein A5637_25315 [Mycolicibacterium fortuitum]|nr:hypothetical protein A5665_16445 [Mycolicibacterium fortuitum]OBK10919.1 hypothetical protein A5637_25315 [Mycolicibacterium fortuitum]OMC10051.1 hypothetical protein A5734_26565 [Mycolicibacterium fortuitum]
MLPVLNMHHRKSGLAGKRDHDMRVGIEAAEKESPAVQVQDDAVRERAVRRFGCADGLERHLAERDTTGPQAPPRAEPLEPRERIDATADQGKALLDRSISLVGNRSTNLDEQGSAGDGVACPRSATGASSRRHSSW